MKSKRKYIKIGLIVLMIIVGLILKARNSVSVFYTNKYIGLMILTLAFLFTYNLIKFGNQKIGIIPKFILFVVFYIISFISISSIIKESTIMFGENKSNKEYFRILNKKSIDNHGIGYFLIIKNKSNPNKIQIIVKKEVYEKSKKNDTILIEYITIGKLIKYTNKYESIIDF